ncbi:MAG: fructosamine kinase family protein [Flavobacteriaceae bacterium]|nr:fructosamine kinase family protein [Flavobacteriaceae bacterium]
MLSKKFLNHISNVIEHSISNVQSVSGGDISKTYLIETSHHKYFLKINSNSNALDMFNAEKKGLEAIANTNTIATPKIFASDIFQNNAFLILEYIESKSPNDKDFENLGQQLAELHKHQSSDFGFIDDNFIGSLPQYNNKNTDWAKFYINQRLLPQIELALSKKLLQHKDVPKTETMHKVCNDIFKQVSPSLLHGDLWGGNYLISTEGKPYLIDPAVYYGHSEVDIAMSKLFGGFGISFYDTYHKSFPKTQEFDARIELYQLYYLLVHLNLFGGSYYNSVKRIFNTYF